MTVPRMMAGLRRWTGARAAGKWAFRASCPTRRAISSRTSSPPSPGSTGRPAHGLRRLRCTVPRAIRFQGLSGGPRNEPFLTAPKAAWDLSAYRGPHRCAPHASAQGRLLPGQPDDAGDGALGGRSVSAFWSLIERQPCQIRRTRQSRRAVLLSRSPELFFDVDQDAGSRPGR